MTSRTQDADRPTHCDVAVVGYGPTGATLANLLAARGLHTVVLEREHQPYPLPRAVHFDAECMRVFQTTGIAQALQARVRVNPGMRFIDTDHTLLLDWPRPQEVGAQGWHASYRLHQPDLEALLRSAFEARTTADIRLGSKVTNIKPMEDALRLSYHTDDGPERRLQAKYVVGCDGARSVVRESMGSTLDSLGFEERWLVVDVVLKRPRPDLGDHTLQYCNPDRPTTYCRNPGNRRRWEFTLLEHEADADVTQSAQLWRFLSPWLTPDDATIERSAVYTFRSAIANRWRHGRVMIAGDAAHLTPPFMGQGMCAGIRDAANLAWKLARCVEHGLDEPLLDSYGQERVPHVEAYINTAVRLGGLINSLDRASALNMASSDTRLKFSPPPLGEHGHALWPKSASDDDSGLLFEQPLLNSGLRLDDAVGYAPVLITRMPSGNVEAAAACQRLDATAHPALASSLDARGTNAILVRPDRYVAATAATPSEIEALANCTLLAGANRQA